MFTAFEDLALAVPRPNHSVAPSDYARQLLASQQATAAIAFVAYLLPRREAVWWACQCVNAILGESAGDAAFRAADAWAQAPDVGRRLAALEIGNARDQKNATTWLALSAGWSGGNINAEGRKRLEPPPSACAKAASAAIVLAACMGDAQSMLPWLTACAEAGIRFAEGGELRVAAPRLVRRSQ